jgi:uncharacterized protein YqgC (DUF456 family)
MATFIYILGVIIIIVGIMFCVLPVVPGQILAYGALLLKYFAIGEPSYSLTFLIIMGVLVLIVTLLDYILPSWIVKKAGGSKYGSWGAFIGTIAGIILTPIGMLFGMFLGAVIGEWICQKNTNRAVAVGLMTFVGFFLSTGIKLLYAVACLWLLFVNI